VKLFYFFGTFNATMLSSTEKEVIPEKENEAKFRSLEAEVASAGLQPSNFLPVFRKKLLATPDPERALNNFLYSCRVHFFIAQNVFRQSGAFEHSIDPV
jgi:hypothetical protein